MHINDLCLKVKDGKIVLCKENKRGNITKYIDVTKDVFKLIVDNYDKESIIHIDSKMYNLTLNEFTDEEYRQYRLIESEKKRKASTKFNSMLTLCQAYKNM